MYLDKIIKYKREELEHIRRCVSQKDVEKKAQDAEPPRKFFEAVANPKKDIRVIAEIKKASPSAGVIREDFDPFRIAAQYEENGAVALSVLTDEHFFQGKLDYLTAIHRQVKLPLLRKDFTLHQYQIYEARGAGSDAILLIARILSKDQIKDYQDLAHELGMACLIEVHEKQELEKLPPKKVGATHASPLLGINNRNLDTFQTDLTTTEQLGKQVPKGVTLVAESGISTRADIDRLLQVPVHAFLIGESLLRQPDPGLALMELIG